MKKSLCMVIIFTVFVSLIGCGMTKAKKDLIKLYTDGTREITLATKMLTDAKTTKDAAKAVDKGSAVIKDVAKEEAAILETTPVPASEDLKKAQEDFLKSANSLKMEISKIPTRFARDKVILDALNRAQE